MFLLLCLWISNAFAHPFGSNLYGHKTEVWVDNNHVRVVYLAEIPTPVLLRELKAYMADLESPTQADQDRHTALILTELADGLRLLVNGDRMEWERLETTDPSGVGDTRFIQYHLNLRAHLPEGARSLNLINGNRPEASALFATDVYIANDVVLDASSQIDVGDDGHIVANRAGAWRGDEEQRELRLSFRMRSAVSAAIGSGFRRVIGGDEGDYADAAAVISTAEPDILPSLVKGELTPRTIVFALFMAFVLGAAHAFSPGHGKALVAAYLLGERRTVRHAFMLGGIVTATHTISVFLLGGVALMLSEVMAPETLLPWMELASGLLVLGVGIQLIRARLRTQSVDEPAHDHDHHHDHDHDHDHDHGHHHHHPHDEDHDAHAAAHAAQLASASTPRDLVALGVSGGLAPCPSALVLLLTAISFHRIGLGLILVAVFSMGLAMVVTAVGTVVVLLGGRIRGRVDSHLVAVIVPRVSAFIITFLGAALTIGGAYSVVGLIGT